MIPSLSSHFRSDIPSSSFSTPSLLLALGESRAATLVQDGYQHEGRISIPIDKNYLIAAKIADKIFQVTSNIPAVIDESMLYNILVPLEESIEAYFILNGMDTSQFDTQTVYKGLHFDTRLGSYVMAFEFYIKDYPVSIPQGQGRSGQV
jgi:hypothetical protein